MTIAGLCHICSKPAMTSCGNCGRLTCAIHIDPATSVCTECAGTKSRKPRGRS